MEPMDLQMAQRVWQRVQGAPREDPVPLLCRLAEECGRELKPLIKSTRGQEKELPALLPGLQQQAACLRGIQRLRSGEPVALRSLIGKQLRLYSQLQSAATDPEYGPVFTALADQTLLTVQKLLILAGR